MELVKIIIDDRGEKQKSPKWHLVKVAAGSPMAVCTGEVFGYGEGSAVYEEKVSDKGGITCENCLAIVKWYKSIKL